MTISLEKLEQNLFRRVNAVVEPTVRRGFGSPSFTPASLIVLETTGFKSGKIRRTPLWSFRVGRYRVVSTVRGTRSFWVKNILQQPRVSYYLAGRRRGSDAIVVAGNAPPPAMEMLTPAMRSLVKAFARYADEGWTFAILAPPVTRTLK